LLAVPGLGVALAPKLACPLCWPFYTGILSTVGLGFLISATYLLPLTIAFLSLTLGVLVFRANQRRGFGPVILGLLASSAVLIGKFHLESNSVLYSGVGLLLTASIWNSWPRRANNTVCSSCTPDSTVQIDGARIRRL
jgi:mercuric ion transport protein